MGNKISISKPFNMVLSFSTDSTFNELINLKISFSCIDILLLQNLQPYPFIWYCGVILISPCSVQFIISGVILFIYIDLS